jgi:hypothetical protein
MNNSTYKILKNMKINNATIGQRIDIALPELIAKGLDLKKGFVVFTQADGSFSIGEIKLAEEDETNLLNAEELCSLT